MSALKPTTTAISARRQWSKRAEQASLNQHRHVLAQGLRDFRGLADMALQLRLAREAATTRAAELTLAYRNVVMVCAGFRQRHLRNGQRRLTRTPCVVFVVRDKWPAGSHPPDHPQHLPAGLLSFVEIDGRRELVAVPTDVQHESAFFGARDQAARAVYLDTAAAEFGTLTCVVELRGPSGPKRYAMSALHVMSPMPEINPRKLTEDAEFSLMAAGVPPVVSTVLGTSLGLGGRLRSESLISFDVQLGAVLSWDALKPMLADMRLSSSHPYLTEEAGFDAISGRKNFELLVPDNHPNAGVPRPTMLAQFLHYMPSSFPIDYDVTLAGDPGISPVHHWQLLQFELLNQRETLPGDSGSPVVVWNNDGSCTLVGMHIAGNGSLSYAIPSWRLFDLDNYWQRPAGTSLQPINL